jgi:hypothetical protein
LVQDGGESKIELTYIEGFLKAQHHQDCHNTQA